MSCTTQFILYGAYRTYVLATMELLGTDHFSKKPLFPKANEDQRKHASLYIIIL